MTLPLPSTSQVNTNDTSGWPTSCAFTGGGGEFTGGRGEFVGGRGGQRRTRLKGECEFTHPHDLVYDGEFIGVSGELVKGEGKFTHLHDLVHDGVDAGVVPHELQVLLGGLPRLLLLLAPRSAARALEPVVTVRGGRVVVDEQLPQLRGGQIVLD
eukprot:1182603-Prorocentrum_minimum.AAC.2